MINLTKKPTNLPQTQQAVLAVKPAIKRRFIKNLKLIFIKTMF